MLNWNQRHQVREGRPGNASLVVSGQSSVVFDELPKRNWGPDPPRPASGSEHLNDHFQHEFEGPQADQLSGLRLNCPSAVQASLAKRVARQCCVGKIKIGKVALLFPSFLDQKRPSILRPLANELHGSLHRNEVPGHGALGFAIPDQAARDDRKFTDFSQCKIDLPVLGSLRTLEIETWIIPTNRVPNRHGE